MSPFCPELLLAYCPSDYARLLREEIGQRVNAGETTESIEDDLVRRYGERIRTMPSFHGSGTIVWLTPPITGVLGLLVVVAALRAATRRAPHLDELESAIEDDALLERVQDELRDLD